MVRYILALLIAFLLRDLFYRAANFDYNVQRDGLDFGKLFLDFLVFFVICFFSFQVLSLFYQFIGFYENRALPKKTDKKLIEGLSFLFTLDIINLSSEEIVQLLFKSENFVNLAKFKLNFKDLIENLREIQFNHKFGKIIIVQQTQLKPK